MGSSKGDREKVGNKEGHKPREYGVLETSGEGILLRMQRPTVSNAKGGEESMDLATEGCYDFGKRSLVRGMDQRAGGVSSRQDGRKRMGISKFSQLFNEILLQRGVKKRGHQCKSPEKYFSVYILGFLLNGKIDYVYVLIRIIYQK